MPQVHRVPWALLFSMAHHKRRNRPAEWPAWFEPKAYPHFDQPIINPDLVRDLVESPDRIARHAFLPFIHFEKLARKYKREPPGFVKKHRPLSYASHIDSLIFRRYCLLLAEKYEALVTDLRIAEAVLAYRRFVPSRCNIHFANDAFRFVEQHAPCVAMAFDVKDFFESLDHKRLKRQWKQVLGVSELPADHYAVFKAVTRYAWVDRKALFELLGITKKKLKNWRGPVCTTQVFRERIRTAARAEGLVQVKVNGKGVPQGSPISALLSNIYMIPIDSQLAASVERYGGLYFRYSDDILIVCPLETKTDLEFELREAMTGIGLELHDGPGKSTISHFVPGEAGVLNCERPLQYLGFAYDGKDVRVRSQTVTKYLRRMQKAVRREKQIAQRRADAGGDSRVRRKRLYRNYTHLGSHNFISSYIKKACEVFVKNKIRAQIKRHWSDLHAALVIE